MGALIAILAIGIVFYALIALKSPRHGLGRGQSAILDRELVQNRWQAISASAASGVGGLKNAVHEADKLLDYVLKAGGYPGSTLAERLKRAEGKLSDKESVWRAHKLRNRLAHEVDYDFLAPSAQDAIKAFERGLKDLGAL